MEDGLKTVRVYVWNDKRKSVTLHYIVQIFLNYLL